MSDHLDELMYAWQAHRRSMWRVRFCLCFVLPLVFVLLLFGMWRNESKFARAKKTLDQTRTQINKIKRDSDALRLDLDVQIKALDGRKRYVDRGLDEK